MDAVEFLKERRRMCVNNDGCKKCLLGVSENGVSCSSLMYNHPEKAVAIIERWSIEHPVKTRQSEFLGIFPEARLDEQNILIICPQSIEEKYICSTSCSYCRKNYWLAEVE